MSIFSERLRELRKARGLTQSELALMLGYTSKSTICKIEKDDRNVPLSKVKEFAAKLEVDPAYLMGWDGEAEHREPMPNAEARYKRFFSQLNEIGQRKAIDYIKDLLDNEKYHI